MIVILLPDLRGGGAERVMLDLAREFSRRGHQVEFCLMQASGEFLAEAQLEFAVVDLAAARTRILAIPLARYLRRRKPDAVIANMWPLTSAAVIGRALSQHRCRLILVEHNTLSRQYASWGRRHAWSMGASMATTHRFADVVAAVSTGAAEDAARLARLPKVRVEALYNPIPQRPQPGPRAVEIADALWNCPPGDRILTVGSLKDQKNHTLLLRAFARTRRTQSRLMLLGQGENEGMLRALASDLGISDRIIFAGFHVDPSPFYATADLFVLSSDYEGLPTVLIESLLFGLPVVSTDCPSGPSEILDNGRFGRLTPVGDAGALAAAMSEALAAEHDRELLRRRAEDFSPERAADKYLALLFPQGFPPPTQR